MQIIERSIFRCLPSKKKNNLEFSETGVEQEQETDPAFRHLQGVYELFLQIISCEQIEVKVLKYFITPEFIGRFMELFDSEDFVERDYLKTILHRLYAKLVPRRKMIRKNFYDTFVSLIHEGYKFNGVAELLDIHAAIISGFAVPLREEHVQFFKNIIIPLHKVQTCSDYFEQLLRCTMLFLSKDRTLSVNLIQSLLKYWPFANSVKETLFLTELQEALEVVDDRQLRELASPLFKRIVKCIGGNHLQVADRSMCLFEYDFFLTKLKSFKDIAFPLFVPVIEELSENHWHQVMKESFTA